MRLEAADSYETPSAPRIFKSLPEAVRLREIQWQLFVTLTFKWKHPQKIRKDMICSWLRKIAKPQRTHFRDELLFCFRWETGPSGDHGHYHAVVGGLKMLSAGFCRAAETCWLKRGGGYSRVRIYNPLLDGVGYVLKQPENYGRSQVLSDDEANIPWLSDSIYPLIGRKTR